MSGRKLDMLASARMHNNANALSLGARFLSIDEAKAALARWLSTAFFRRNAALPPYQTNRRPIDLVGRYAYG